MITRLLVNAMAVARQEAEAAGGPMLHLDGGDVSVQQDGPVTPRHSCRSTDSPGPPTGGTRWFRCSRGPVASSGSTCWAMAGRPSRPGRAMRSRSRDGGSAQPWTGSA